MVISEPEADTRTVLKYTGPGTAIFSGYGNVTMLCGHCERPLAERVKMGTLRNLVLVCKNCGSFNDTLA
jgi:hypothetical protein